MDPGAERALRELEQRCRDAGPSTSLVAQAQRREERQRRQQQRAPSTQATLQSMVVDARDDPPVAVCVDAAASDLDPRELEPWFRELPADEQQRLHDCWHEERHRFDDRAKISRRRLGRVAVYGGLLFGFMGLLLAPLLGTFAKAVPLLVAGAIAASGAHAFGGGRFVFAGAGSIAFVCVMGLTVFIQPLSFAALMLASFGMGLVGMDGEMRNSGGFGQQ